MEHPTIQDLYTQYGDELQRYLTRRVQSVDTAADLTQEAFVRLLRREPDVELENPRAYLYTVAGNLANDHLQKAHTRYAARNAGEVETPDCAPGPERRFLAKEALQRLEQAIDTLPPRQREIIRLHKFEHLSYEAIAVRLGISKNTVMVHMMRALKHCRDCMAKE